MSKINLVTVCTDDYPMVYPVKLHRQFQRLTRLSVSHYCITDRPSELSNNIMPITPFIKSEGWWNKINLYSSQMPKGIILYMDLDIVILQNFDAEIIAMSECGYSISCVSDAISWKGEKFSSSLMCFKSGEHNEIFERFEKFESAIVGREGGDQVWTGPQIESIYYADDHYPNLKKNLKFDLARKTPENELILPQTIDSRVKLVDCGGRPKPHELQMIPYINENWHLV